MVKKLFTPKKLERTTIHIAREQKQKSEIRQFTTAELTQMDASISQSKYQSMVQQLHRPKSNSFIMGG